MATALIEPVRGATREELERRAADRYACHREATSTSADGTAAIRWGAVIRDLSRAGVGLSLCFPFKPGTYLAVQVTGRDERPQCLMARVIHVHELGNGSWHLGCELLAPLTDSELADLL